VIIPDNRQVLAFLWQDKTLVRFLTTAYHMRPNPENFTIQPRRRPYCPRTRTPYRDMITEVWGQLPVRELAVPTATADYNLYMGGVDIADQRRSYYSTQLQVVRTWMPIFFWLLDTTIINSFLLAGQTMSSDRNPQWSVHSKFRERLAWDLVEQGFQQLNPTHSQQLQSLPPPPTLKPHGRYCAGITPPGNNSQSRAKGYVTKHTALPTMRKDPVRHNLIRNETKKAPQLCFLCRFLSKCSPNTSQHDAFISAPNGPHGSVRRTHFICNYCSISDTQISLCKDFCFDFFHICNQYLYSTCHI